MYVAVDKPAGVLTTRNQEGDVALTELVKRELCPGAEVVHPLSRLDFDVTGVVVFATSYEATQRASNLRSSGKYQREYHALVSPPPAQESFEWRWSIGVDPRDPNRRVAGRGRDEESAHTVGRVRDRRGAVAWLELTPVTGRTHQLRVHCAKAGCAVLGDRTYRGAKRVTLTDGAVVAVPRVMLHCARVSLAGDVVVQSIVPEDFSALWATLANGDSPQA